jgi:hypothetical protein
VTALDALAPEPRWVAWRIEIRGGKPTKVPYAPQGGRAKADNPSTWGSRAEAEAMAAKIINGQGGGVGIELGDLGGDTHLAGIDLDSCLSDGGTLAPWAEAIIHTVRSCAEVSPSGSGIKLFFFVTSEDVRPFLDRIGAPQWQWGVRRDVPGEDARDHGPAIEVYFARRYFTVTGQQWAPAPDKLTMLDGETLEQLATLIPSARSDVGRNGKGSADNSRSAIAFRKGASLRRDGKTFDEMVAALRTDPETADWVREKGDTNAGRELRRIWDRAIDQQQWNAKADGGPAPHRFNLVRFKDIKLNPTAVYLVNRLIPREGLVIIWGPPKFWTFDIVMHIALGWVYRGRRVIQGTVVYVACEGERGLAARAIAFREGKNVDEEDPPFFLLTTRLDLVADVEALIGEISVELGAANCAVIVIDTLNRSLAGSESKDEDMSAYIRATDRLREAFGCAVLVIHHCGINGNRPRGHTSLTGAADAQIAVKRDAGDGITTIVEYMKDGPEGEETASRLIAIDVGTEEDGEPITSCIIEATAAAPQKRRKPIGGQAGIAFRLLQNALADQGERPPDHINFPANRKVVPLSVWRAYCQKSGLVEGDNEEALKKAWQRVRERLLSAGFIGIWDQRVWIAEPEGDRET